MRFYMASLARAKAVAKTMRLLLEPFRPDLKLSGCQTLTAQMYGYPNWHALGKSHSEAPPTLDDAYVDIDQVAARKLEFTDNLQRAGVSIEIARYLVESLHPSSAQHPTFASRATFLEHLSLLVAPFKPEPDTFWLGVEGNNCGCIGLRFGGKLHDFPLRRPDLAESAKALFSREAGNHPAERTEMSGPHKIAAWRTQWNGEDTGYRAPAILMGRALYRQIQKPDVDEKGFGPKASLTDELTRVSHHA